MICPTDDSEGSLWDNLPVTMINDPALLSRPLPDSDIHIWYASLNVSPQDLACYRSSLSQDEVEQAERFYFEKDRNHFIAGRGILRTILGGYLNIAPAKIEFVYGPHGKPALQMGSKDRVLEFNLSHSKDRAIYAFNWDRKIGVDIEYRIPMADIDDFAERFFTQSESVFINSLMGHQKDDAFFKTWTCKEAFLKANGSGLTVPINHVEIILDISDRTVTLNSIGGDRDQAAGWRLEMFDPFPGYQAALAVEGQMRQIVFQHFNGPSE